jgi:multidrug resistance efflux pump
MTRPAEPVNYAEAYNEAIEALMAEQEKGERLTAESSRLSALLAEAKSQMAKAARLSLEHSDYRLHADEYFRRALESLKTPLKAPTTTVEGGE